MVTTTSEKDGDAAGCWTMAYARAHFYALPVSSSIQQYPAVSCSIPVSDAPAPSISVKILRDTAMAILQVLHSNSVSEYREEHPTGRKEGHRFSASPH